MASNLPDYCASAKPYVEEVIYMPEIAPNPTAPPVQPAPTATPDAVESSRLIYEKGEDASRPFFALYHYSL